MGTFEPHKTNLVLSISLYWLVKNRTKFPQCNIVINPYVEFMPILITVTNWFCQKLIWFCIVSVFVYSTFFESSSKSPWQQALLSPSHRSSHQSLDVSSTELLGCSLKHTQQKLQSSLCLLWAAMKFMGSVFVQKGCFPCCVRFSTWLNLQCNGAVHEWI